MPSTTAPTAEVKKKRTQVKVACVNCQKACKKCDNARPCPRCIRRGLEQTCVDIERKPRKTGTKRGPYNKKKNWKLEMLAIVCSYILENDGNRLEKILSEIKNEQIKNFFADERNRIKINNLFELVCTTTPSSSSSSTSSSSSSSTTTASPALTTPTTPTPNSLANHVNPRMTREVTCPK